MHTVFLFSQHLSSLSDHSLPFLFSLFPLFVPSPWLHTLSVFRLPPFSSLASFFSVKIRMNKKILAVEFTVDENRYKLFNVQVDVCSGDEARGCLSSSSKLVDGWVNSPEIIRKLTSECRVSAMGWTCPADWSSRVLSSLAHGLGSFGSSCKYKMWMKMFNAFGQKKITQ